MASGWTNNQPDSLTLPPGALPTDPRIVIGDDIPGNIAHLTAALLFYANDNLGNLVCFYFGVGPGDANGANIELGFFPTNTTDPSATQVVLKYQYDYEFATQPIMTVNAFRTIFEGLGANQEVAFFQDYDISGDENSTFYWFGPFNLNGRRMSGSHKALYVDAGPAAGNTTNSTAYVDLPGGNTSLECVKRYSSALTNLRVTLFVTVRSTAPCTVRWATNIGTVGVGAGSDFSVGQQRIDVANVASHYSMTREIPGLGAGNRLVQIRWRVNSGAGPTLTFGPDYSVSLLVEEVPV